ncbi:hypothetical protein U9M48_037684 [Paspalum notatum var. saurae]|uniref:TF-B3 domain-containing protein n=1 Tax=Paspalum notatum var. saurae TaxID=547442 RepID=A0AAQ3XAX2_PASNO
MAAHADAVGGGRHHKFFKILMPGSFELSLSIPAKFVADLGDCRPCGARLRHRNRIRTGRGRPSTSWDVDLVRHDDGRLSLTGRGWLDFVSANAISAGHLLVFEHLNSHGAGGSSLLDLAVDLFDASGCCCCCRLISSDADIVGGLQQQQQQQQQREKYSSSNNGGCHDDDKQDGGGTAAAKKALVDEENKSAANNNCRRWRCEPAAIIPCTGGVVLNKRRKVTGSITTTTTSTSTIGGSVSNGGQQQQQQQQDEDETLCRRIERPYQLRFLDLSKSFCDRVGWSSSRDVVLCAAGDMSNNNRWQVSVKVTAKSGGMMCTGWAEFAADNGLAISDACVFIPPPQQPSSSSEHHHHDVLQVHVLRGSRGS